MWNTIRAISLDIANEIESSFSRSSVAVNSTDTDGKRMKHAVCNNVNSRARTARRVCYDFAGVERL